MGVADEAPQEPVEGGWDVSDDRKFFGGLRYTARLCAHISGRTAKDLYLAPAVVVKARRVRDSDTIWPSEATTILLGFLRCRIDRGRPSLLLRKLVNSTSIWPTPRP